jgi:hypothetical protein
LKRQNRHIPALSIASAINEQLNCLLPTFSSVGVPAHRALMFSEAARRDTFVKWPHMNYKYVTFEFYYTVQTPCLNPWAPNVRYTHHTMRRLKHLLWS